MLLPSHPAPGDRHSILSATGINLAFVKLARDSGAKVLIADKALSAEGKEYLHGAAGDVVFQECDVRDWADLKRLVPRAVEAFGDVPDVYVAGAGIFEPVSRVFAPAAWRGEEGRAKKAH